ncbi:haloacid dehalogenase-like hydrolase [Noviherbaspirillum cavernae]|uniref:Haloacid dehalogenase-like hydrolase n=1 Tax=Noviherbaspirillum cavernae TaxID=2320862 RepID=A0A418WZV8_9BURK|nr:HAD family hydrolase [Noviherbaspirillum cavernae]RJG05746.1 haloacid dehalogenase-like hydrolase [Noviherbaspirillum cavernae]
MSDTLASWNDGGARSAIIGFVDRITKAGTSDFVPSQERIAVFDNDGTLWCEKPLPIQADFLFRRLAQMVEKDPSLGTRQPWKAVVEKDYVWLGAAIEKHYRGDDSALKMMIGGLLQCYQGVSIEEFETTAGDFLRSAQHPVLKRPYLECTYRPMIELLRYLEANGFTCYIASGGSRDFMRPVTQGLYGIPPERVIGSTVALEYQEDASGGCIVHKPELDIFDDGPAKPVRIWSRIGRRPIFAAGNSNGDIQMLHYCSDPARPSFKLLVNHDDKEREFDYVAGAEESLKLAQQEGWTVASIRTDWRTVFSDTSLQG